MKLLKQLRKDLTQDKPVIRFLAFGGAVAATWLSLQMNITYWYGVQGTGGVVGSLATDLMKPVLVAMVAEFIAARQWGKGLPLVLALVAFVFLSLFSAYNVRIEAIRADQTLKAAQLEKRNNIYRDYKELRRNAVVSGGLTDPATARQNLKDAEGRVPRRIWRRTSACTDATKKSSQNACKRVISLRLALPGVEQKWRIHQKYLAARTAFRSLPPVAKSTTSDEMRELAEILLVLSIEYLSAFGFWIATARPAGRPIKPRKTAPASQKPDELHWLDAMKAAAADPEIEGIGFDENGLIRAPLSKLAGVLEVKSTSTVAERMKALESAGLLKRRGKGKALRYELEPA